MMGTRKHVDAAGELLLAEGEYGQDRAGTWFARPFGMHMGGLENHDVTEHEDGTITVHPSILIISGRGNGEVRWHGYLERGVWREVD